MSRQLALDTIHLKSVDRFDQSHCLVGSFVDCRDMTFGTWEKVKADMDRTFDLAPRCKGLIFAVGNHLPANIPAGMMRKYIAHFSAFRNRKEHQ